VTPERLKEIEGYLEGSEETAPPSLRTDYPFALIALRELLTYAVEKLAPVGENGDS
jgi:hypothetical protein